MNRRITERAGESSSTSAPVQRIDGRRYLVGSREHDAAIKLAAKRNASALVRTGIAENMDANAVGFLARDLVYVSSNVQQVLYDALIAQSLVPFVSEVPAGAQAWGYASEDEVGEALIGANLQADDHPLVDLSMDEHLFPLLNITAGYIYDVGELEQAAFARKPLSRRKAEICARVIARGINRVALVGKPSLGIYGLFNNPDVPEITLTNGEWLTATADEILADLAQIEAAATTNNRDNFSFDTLLLPTAYEARLRQLPVVAGSDITIWHYFFGGGGVSGTGRMLRNLDRLLALDEASGSDIAVDDAPMGIAYTRSASVVSMDVPIPYREEPPQARNFKFVVPARARVTGVTFHQPTAALYIKNLD